MMEAIGKNLKYSKNKFVISPNNLFAVMELTGNPTGRVTISHERKRSETLCQLQTLGSTNEVKCLLRLISTFN